MKISPVNQNSNTSFKGFYNNKTLLWGLEKISDHCASFSLGVSFLGALVLRPFAIHHVPKTDSENKKYAEANSIGSALIKFLMAEAVTFPLEKAVNNISIEPEKYLNKDAIENFTTNSVTNKEFKNASQILKLSSNLLCALPKSLLTVALIPVITDKILKLDDKKQTKKNIRELSFKGKFEDKITKRTASFFNNISFINFIKKHNFKEQNLARNMSIITDIALVGTSSYGIKKSKKIKEDKKRALIYNNLISTGLCILAGFSLDNIIQKAGSGFVNKFQKVNKDNPKLSKYLQGINVLRPAVIFTIIYYGILPLFSTYFSDKIDKYKKDNENIEKF